MTEVKAEVTSCGGKGGQREVGSSVVPQHGGRIFKPSSPYKSDGGTRMGLGYDRRSNRASESIPNRRHRAKTAPTEQSIGFAWYTSLVSGSGSGLRNGRLASSTVP